MPKYHVNTKTGETGRCGARKRCPFGDLKTEHFTEEADARKHYEKIGAPVHDLEVAGDRISALRRNAYFVEQPGDDELMDRLENLEDYRNDSGGQQEEFSILELKRIAEMADETTAYYYDDSDDDDDRKLDSESLSIVKRLGELRYAAASKAEKELLKGK